MKTTAYNEAVRALGCARGGETPEVVTAAVRTAIPFALLAIADEIRALHSAPMNERPHAEGKR